MQTPRFAQPGEDGRKAGSFWVSMRMSAIGFRTPGFATITNAKPKIADYAFTTLEPNLGIVSTMTIDRS